LKLKTYGILVLRSVYTKPDVVGFFMGNEKNLVPSWESLSRVFCGRN